MIIELEKIKNLVIVKLYRRKCIGKPLDFDDFGKKVDKTLLLKALKKLRNEDIVIWKPSLRSKKGRWALNPRTKYIWEKIALELIRKGQ